MNSTEPIKGTSQSNMLLTVVLAVMIFAVLGSFVSSVLLLDAQGQTGALSSVYKKAALGLGIYNLIFSVVLFIVVLVTYLHRSRTAMSLNRTISGLKNGESVTVVPHQYVTQTYHDASVDELPKTPPQSPPQKQPLRQPQNATVRSATGHNDADDGMYDLFA